MALPVQLTLDEARIEVLQRLGFAQQGTAVLRNHNLIDSFIRQSMNQLAHEANWSDLYKELQIPLVDGQGRYEFPDEASIGQIDTIWVLDINNRAYQLAGGTQWQDFSGEGSQDSQYAEVTGEPRKWQIINRELRIYPAPNTDTYTNLNIRYVSRLPRLIEDSEYLPFDSELIVQQAVILGKRHYGMPGVSEAMGDLARYLDRVKTAQRESRVFNVGGSKSHFVTRAKEPDGMQRKSYGPNSTYSDGWNPW